MKLISTKPIVLGMTKESNLQVQNQTVFHHAVNFIALNYDLNLSIYRILLKIYKKVLSNK